MNSISKPTLLIDTLKAERNIKMMAEKARRSKVIFRPHFKTHQSIEMGNLYRKHGIDKITVSSVEMAQFFAANNWHDITLAFPVNPREIKQINKLATSINLNLLVESVYVAELLEKNLTGNVGIFIKIDVGYHRTGLAPSDPEIEKITKLLKSSSKMQFRGFLTHAGHTYHTKGREETLSILESAKQQLTKLKQKYIAGFPDIIISYGDTPSCSMAENCNGFDEIRPGNFVYYDVMQYHLGSCSLDDIAVAAACPVIAVHPEREEIVIYGGAVHLSKEAIEGDNGFKMFGYVVAPTPKGWSKPIAGAYVSGLSQEHGIVSMPVKELNRFKPGDLLGILPIHSCLTANLLRQQVTV